MKSPATDDQCIGHAPYPVQLQGKTNRSRQKTTALGDLLKFARGSQLKKIDTNQIQQIRPKRVTLSKINSVVQNSKTAVKNTLLLNSRQQIWFFERLTLVLLFNKEFTEVTVVGSWLQELQQPCHSYRHISSIPMCTSISRKKAHAVYSEHPTSLAVRRG